MTSVIRAGLAELSRSRLHPAGIRRPYGGGLASGTLTTRPRRTWWGPA
jgi:hypothetical protein